jgi:hypothetical protein
MRASGNMCNKSYQTHISDFFMLICLLLYGVSQDISLILLEYLMHVILGTTLWHAAFGTKRPITGNSRYASSLCDELIRKVELDDILVGDSGRLASDVKLHYHAVSPTLSKGC